MPETEYLNELFEYKNGSLIWKIRPLHHFNDESTMRRFNTKCSGKLAGGSYGSTNPYMNVRIDGISYQVHRIIFKLHTEEEPEYIDHIDRNKLNNKIENLRKINQRHNSENSNSISYKGNNYYGKFRVRVRYKKKLYQIGMFLTKECARSVYDEFQRKVFNKDLTEEELRDIISSLKPKRK